jgi:hypothetical protein
MKIYIQWKTNEEQLLPRATISMERKYKYDFKADLEDTDWSNYCEECRVLSYKCDLCIIDIIMENIIMENIK